MIEYINLITFNIRSFFFKDLFSNKSWFRRRRYVVDHIFKSGQSVPDIICLQEVKAPLQLQYLKRKLKKRGYKYVYDSAYNKIMTPFMNGLAIFYDNYKFRLTKHYTYNITEGDDWLDAGMRRIIQVVELRDNETGEDIAVYNLHFDHKSSKSKTKGVEILKKRFYAHSNMVVAGDFNFTEECEWYKEMIKNGFVDMNRSPLALHIRNQNVGTSNQFKYPEPPRSHRIDFILTKGVGFRKRQKVRTVKVNTDTSRFGKKSNIYSSDHYPIIATFKIK